MAAAQERRQLDDLLFCLAAEDDEDESFEEDIESILAFYIMNEPQSHLSFTIDLDKIDENACINLFRFAKNDIHQLLLHFSIPAFYKCPNGTVASGLEAFLILLRRLTYPNRLSDLCFLFGRPEPELSMIVHQILNDIYERYHYLLEELDQNWIQVDVFARAIHDSGSPIKNCWGFIDGTLRPCCRPIRNQRILFSGHKRVHGLKFQSVVCPNGLISNLYGPIAGKHHDAFMLHESKLLPKLEDLFRPPQIFTLYGDPAYPLRPHLLAPYRGAAVTRDQQSFNKSMSKLRVSVEWTFGKLVQYFAFLDFKKNLKFQSPMHGFETLAPFPSFH
ncbi:protein ALP1-like isoform X2 [Dendronephthya gigantea]|uniref:protein ALP1-like isoform X2 n=1 Tax=Dendronephthya gigantea TaxID=151771 RepID=UPI00106C8012|nr:protein ALP1-like isoform X2 [Dendronephthya gigantea]